MADYDVSDLIESGSYALTIPALEDTPLLGSQVCYQVVEGGEVQEDGSVPIKVRMSLPARLAGQIVEAKLVPQTAKEQKMNAELAALLGTRSWASPVGET